VCNNSWDDKIRLINDYFKALSPPEMENISNSACSNQDGPNSGLFMSQYE